ncbi:hypothetical protein PHLGIDRAFT_99086 [Phlebiopsis gigantea 11061_1 CR5-6]|uniref:NADP-dependent oxidoreductase domain-containing protein n=1 Tax=Phlebiopsis gigantea (strain 11061_1 CR5-6) TaxID=745531 RepID=A0A0C3SDB9_PHLG1|nr:hypothetical protein PHLGIDRAFT_99086 [Phlebiopsis gigantea 11061_1 CR5-6]
MPVVGFGLWKVPRPQCADTVYNALKAGYRLLDGAGDYGNEKEAGEGLARAIKDGIVKREEVFVTSKLWNTYHQKERAKELAKHQLELWGIEYFDLYLIHFPISLEDVAIKDKYPPEWWGLDGKVHPTKVPIRETWEALEEIADAGLAKNIGVSNFQGSLLVDLLRYARIEPSVLQVELHPYLAQKKLVALTKELGIAITAYSSLGPQSYLELGAHHSVPGLLSHNTVTSIAEATGKSPAQVLLRWAVQQGLAVIPKSNNHDRLLSNLQVTEFTLSDEQVTALDALDINLRMNDPQDIHPALGIFA